MTTTSEPRKLTADDKLKAVHAYLQRGTLSVREVAESAGIKIPTLMYYVNQYKRTGSLEDGRAMRAKKKEPAAIVVRQKPRTARAAPTLLDHSAYERGIEDYILENRELRKENQRLRRALQALLE